MTSTNQKPYAVDASRGLAPGKDFDAIDAVWVAVCAPNREDLADNMDVLTDAVAYGRRRYRLDSTAGYDRVAGPFQDDGNVQAPLVHQNGFDHGITTAQQYLQQAAQQNVASRAGATKGYVLYVRVRG